MPRPKPKAPALAAQVKAGTLKVRKASRGERKRFAAEAERRREELRAGGQITGSQQ